MNQYVFSLIGIDMSKIDKLINTQEIDKIDNTIIPVNSTKLIDLETDKKIPDFLSFILESKTLHKCTISMIDFKTKKTRSKKPYKCFWDRNIIPEEMIPIGCPIKYIPSRVIKTYHSSISKEKYVITEPVTEERRAEVEIKNTNQKFTSEKNDYYETDGIFCSFNCCLAYIEAYGNRKNPLYKNSRSLLFQMYTDINNGGDPSSIIPAPHWRLLEEFGGHLTIEQFKESFNKIKYTYRGSIIFKSHGKLFEDQIKF
jgi:hypothetical protein